MKALTVRQPYAQLLAIGAKQYETRPMSTKHRGPIAIHAGKNEKGAKALLAQMALAKTSMRCDVFRLGTFPHEASEVMFPWTQFDLSHKTPRLNLFPFGAIIAYADIVGCYPVEDIKNLTDRERLFGDWTPGRYAWEIAHVVMLSQPIPCKGQLGLWNVNSSVEAQILAMEDGDS